MKIDHELKLPPEEKDEFGYTPSQNKIIEKQMVKDTSKSKGAWKAFVKANQEAEKKAKPRQENVIERINRINYEYGDSKKRPKHLDNKDIYSFEDQEIFKNNINKKDLRVANHLKRQWGLLDPKKKGVQYVGSRRYTMEDEPKKEKPTPTVNVSDISAGLNNYYKINKETEIKRPEILNEKFYDDDVEKGLGSLLGIDKNFRK